MDSRCASAAPQLAQVIASGVAGVPHHAHERAVSGAAGPSPGVPNPVSADSKRAPSSSLTPTG